MTSRTLALTLQRLSRRTVALLDRETDTGEHAHGELEPLFDNPVYME